MSKDLKDLIRADPETAALYNMISRGAKWGNAVYRVEEAKKAAESPAERKARLAEEKKRRAELDAMIKRGEEEKKKAMEMNTKEKELDARKANVAKKKARHVNKFTGTLKKIAKMCKYECNGEECWSHSSGVCPYIHRGQSGWNESKAKKPKKGGATCTRKRRKY
jgi:hypothetical protein